MNEIDKAYAAIKVIVDARSDRIELAGQINEASQEYAKLLGNDHPSDAEALAIGLALGVLKQLVASWEPK